MPPKNTKNAKNTVAFKKEQAEKVREIQKRQQNWLRQRDDHLKNDSEDAAFQLTNSSRNSPNGAESMNSRLLQAPITGGADILKVTHGSPASSLSSKVSEKLNVKIKHGFGNWLHAREDTGGNSQSQSQQVQGGRKEISNGQGKRSYTDVERNGTQNDLSREYTSSSYQSSPLSPDEFDSVADSIASRVKLNLGINNSSSGYSDSGRYRSEHVPHSSKFTNKQDEAESRGASVSSHHCPICSSLMINTNRAPTLLVPCGHTMCKACAGESTYCSLCGTRVASLTTNIMLQQIISDYHSTRLHQSQQHAPPALSRGNIATMQTSKPAAKPEKVDYSSQLKTLCDRRSNLEEEAYTKRKDKDQLNAKMTRAEQQLNAIMKHEAKLTEQLRQAQEGLAELKPHREEMTQEVKQLTQRHRTAHDTVTQIETALDTLDQEIDKMQFLAEGQKDMPQNGRLGRR